MLMGGTLGKGCWRIFLDPNQNLFGGVAASTLQRVREANPTQWPLTVNCRNTAPIAAQVALLSGVPLSEALAPDGPDVAIRWYETSDDEARIIQEAIQELAGEGFDSEQGVILSRHRFESSAANQSGLKLTDVSRGQEGRRAPGIRFSTIASFKGLEAAVVFLTDVDDLTSNEGLASVYVGTSRARDALYVFIAKSQTERFQDLAKEFGRTLVEDGRNAAMEV